jgi:polyisoprenoid-binding protein YceI
METGPLPGSGRASPDAPRAGRRRQGASGEPRDAAGQRWDWLAELGPGQIRLTPENVTVSISVRWLGGLVVRGTFADLRGTLHVPSDDDRTAAVTVEIRADSVRTGISLRDRHLRGPLFLDAVHHPLITFRGGDVMRWPTHVSVPGSLTIRGVTRTEELRCALDGVATGGGLVADATLSRRAYGVGVPRGLRRLDPLFAVIGDDVRISIRVVV